MARAFALFLAALILTATSTSCSVVRPSKQAVQFTSPKPGVVVMVDGQYFETPFVVKLRRNETHVYRAEKEGFRSVHGSIEPHLNTTGVLDIVGTVLFLVPVVGLITPGAFSLDPTQVHIGLIQE